MYQDTYFVPKRTGTYSDVLVAYGLAGLIDHIFRQVKGPTGRWQITLEDGGGYYLVRLSEPLREEWLDAIHFFASPAKYLTGRYTAPNEISADTPALDIEGTWDQIKAYHQMRSSLWDKGLRGTDLEQQIQDARPSREAQIVIFLGDYNLKAVYPSQKQGVPGSYNKTVAYWNETREQFGQYLRIVLSCYFTPDVNWGEFQGPLFAKLNASQALSPHQGKGQNSTKADSLRMDNVPGAPWIEEYLRAAGFWLAAMPRSASDTKDWKTYVLAPKTLQLSAHRTVYDLFSSYLWKERRGDATSLKTDITSVLLFSRAWLDYVEAAWRDEDDFDIPVAPEQVVAGFHVAQFKLLSRNAYTMVNLSFLSLPAWSGELRTRADVVAVQQIIDEHLDVIRGIDEGHSDGFDLLRRYRDFVSSGNWDAFFDFMAGYSHEILRRLNDGTRYVPTFTTSRLRRLMMTNRKDLTPIVENNGFQNVAYAIRHATIIPQRRKANKQDNLYEVRYGLGAELKRKGTVRDEFVAALTDFIQSYNQENVQKLESKGQQMRRDVRIDDIAEVVRLIDIYGSEVVANLLIAYGYAGEPREEQPNT